jgi:lysophospholipase
MRLISIPANPVPEDAATAMLRTPDEVLLRYARWAPPPGRKGTVCIFQGRAEFIEKYFEVVRDLRARGFAVATLDWRGQGLSQRALKDPFRGHVGSFAEYATDLETFMKEVVLPDCPPPLFALAHSMGAAVLIQAAARGHRWFDRMVLTAPMIRLTNRRLLSLAPGLARALRFTGRGSTYVPGGSATVLARGSFLGNPLTSDPVRYARAAAVLEADPALGLGSPTIAWADAAFRVMSLLRVPSYPARIRQPILIVAAGRDRLVSTPAIENFAIHLRAGSHLIIPGAEHEILMEQDPLRQQFWAAFDAFVPGSPMYGSERAASSE